MIEHDACHCSEVAERSARRAVYAHRGAQAVLERLSDHPAGSGQGQGSARRYPNVGLKLWRGTTDGTGTIG